MITKELIEYIKTCREQNISDEQIKATLKEQNWSDEDINAGLSQISQPTETIQPVEFTETRKSKKKFLIPLIVIIGVLIIGGGIFAYFQFFREGSGELKNVEKTEELSAMEICNKIGDEADRNWCLARVNKDVSLCEGASRVKDMCVEDVITDIAVQKKDVKECKGDSSCYPDVAVITQNPEICENIESEFLLNECLIGIAVFAEDIGLCQNIESDYYKKECEIILGKDSSLCPELNQKASDSLRCKGTIAVLTNNPSLCVGTEGVGAGWCYAAVALKTEDDSVCKNFGESEDYYNCMAMAKKDVSFCELLDNKDLYYKDYCLSELALSLSGLEIYTSAFHYVSRLPK